MGCPEHGRSQSGIPTPQQEGRSMAGASVGCPGGRSSREVSGAHQEGCPEHSRKIETNPESSIFNEPLTSLIVHRILQGPSSALVSLEVGKT